MHFAPCSHCCSNTQTNKQTGDSETLFGFCTTSLHCLGQCEQPGVVSLSEAVFSESCRFAENNASIVNACISTVVNEFLARCQHFFQQPTDKQSLGERRVSFGTPMHLGEGRDMIVFTDSRQHTKHIACAGTLCLTIRTINASVRSQLRFESRRQQNYEYGPCFETQVTKKLPMHRSKLVYSPRTCAFALVFRALVFVFTFWCQTSSRSGKTSRTCRNAAAGLMSGVSSTNFVTNAATSCGIF